VGQLLLSIHKPILGQLCFVCQLWHHYVNASLLLYTSSVMIDTCPRRYKGGGGLPSFFPATELACMLIADCM
jgi:hypothetical protein